MVLELQRWRLPLAGGAVFLVLALLVPSGAAQEPLTLRVNDAIGAPGGLAAVVLRTYASRGIGQGQTCLVGTGQGPFLPFATLEDVVVWSAEDDVRSEAMLEQNGAAQIAKLNMLSPSATINLTDGPLAVFYFRLADDLVPGASYHLRIDPADSPWLDDAGLPVPLEPVHGELEIRAADDPYHVDAEGDRVPPGGRADLGFETAEPFPIASGELVLRYPPELAAGPPRVLSDPRYGTVDFRVDTATPGRVRITFTSPDASFNRVPGHVFTVSLVTRVTLPPGTVGRISVDPELSHLEGAGGERLAFVSEDDLLELESLELRFADGFASGDLGAWSAAFP